MRHAARTARSEECLLSERISFMNRKNDPNKENFDKLLGELKELIKNKDEKIFRKSTSLSHEDVGPALAPPKPARCLPIHPVAKKPSYLVTEEGPVLEHKSIFQKEAGSSVFKPIRSEEITPPLMDTKNLITLSEEDVEIAEGITAMQKIEKTIHESLRMPKAKRRQSLPCFDQGEQTSSCVVSEAGKTHGSSYYSSLRQDSKEYRKTEYYSSLLSSTADESGAASLALKSASDECVYNEARDYSGSTYSKLNALDSLGSQDDKQDSELYCSGAGGSKMYRRISVTEPSSPAEDYAFQEAAKAPDAQPSTSQLAESDLSDTDSDSSADRVLSSLKKSKSFVERKDSASTNMSNSCESLSREATSHTKRLKALKPKVRKQSASSTSSYDSPFRPHPVRKSCKGRLKSDSENTPMKGQRREDVCSMHIKKSLSCHVKNENSQREAYWSEDFDEKLRGGEDHFQDRKKTFQGSGRFGKSDRSLRERPVAVVRKPPRKMSVDEVEKCSDFCPVKRERAKSWNRELDREERTEERLRETKPSKAERRDLTPEVYLYLLQILTQQSRREPNESHSQFSSKSLPRNHKSRFQKTSKLSDQPEPSSIARHLDDGLKCEKDCLKILKAVSKESTIKIDEESRGLMSLGRDKGRKSRKQSLERSLDLNDVMKRWHQSSERQQKGKEVVLVPDIAKPSRNQRTKRGSEGAPAKHVKKLDEECVIRIEDGNLWIEICKAVQETEAKQRKLKRTLIVDPNY